MTRIFVNKKENDYFILENKDLKHLKVLRINKDFFLCNYDNEFYKCILENEKAKIINKISINNEFKNEVVLAIALINPKNFELILQKATELGVNKIIPFISNFTNYNKDFAIKKLSRWEEIIKNAAEQSFRNKIPIITNPIIFEEVLDIKINNKFIAYENENSNSIWQSFPTNSLFIIGPEGGFSKDEINKAIEKKFNLISLGKRILRSETAAFFVLSRINE